MLPSIAHSGPATIQIAHKEGSLFVKGGRYVVLCHIDLLKESLTICSPAGLTKGQILLSRLKILSVKSKKQKRRS